MKTQPTPPPAGAVVVGVGLERANAALSYAAEEACRTHSPLHIVHVQRISAAEAYAGVYQGAFEAAEEVVKESRELAEKLVNGQVPVTAERVDDGWLVADLVDRASKARMLVLEHRRQSQAHRLVTGSIVTSTASRCPAPLVSVPSDWTPDTGAGIDEPGTVTVGVQDAGEAGALIRRGIAEAAARGADLEVVHAWWLYGGYDSWTADEEFCEKRERRFKADILTDLEAARAEHPEVRVSVQVLHAMPAPALLECGDSSQLLVIGRRHHLLPLGSHLGPVARTLLQHSTSPVLLEPGTPREATEKADHPAYAVVGANA